MTFRLGIMSKFEVFSAFMLAKTSINGSVIDKSKSNKSELGFDWSYVRLSNGAAKSSPNKFEVRSSAGVDLFISFLQ